MANRPQAHFCIHASSTVGAPVLVPRSWYQDLRRAREAEPLGMQGGTGGCRPPARGSGGLEAPQEEQGVWGAAAPQ